MRDTNTNTTTETPDSNIPPRTVSQSARRKKNAAVVPNLPFPVPLPSPLPILPRDPLFLTDGSRDSVGRAVGLRDVVGAGSKVLDCEGGVGLELYCSNCKCDDLSHLLCVFVDTSREEGGE